METSRTRVDSVQTTVLRYRTRAVSAIQVVYLACVAAVLIAFPPSKVVVWTFCLVSVLFSVVSLLFARSGHAGLAVWILSCQMLSMATGLAISGRGVYDITTMIFPAGMLAMAIVARPWATTAYSGLNLAAAGVVFWASATGRTGIALDHVPTDDIILDGIGAMAIALFIGVLASYMSRVLSGLLDTLARHQDSLEATVNERTASLQASNSELRSTLDTLDRTRTELVRKEKLASLGRMVAGIAHELNTPIGNSLLAASNLQNSLEQLPAPSRTTSDQPPDVESFLSLCGTSLDLMLAALHKAGELVSRFKQIAVDRYEDHHDRYELAQLVDHALILARANLDTISWESRVEIAGPLDCDGYPEALKEILLNLMENALVHGRQDGSALIVIRAGADEQTVWLELSDNGPGIPPELREKIFEPFFSASKSRKSTGLGLTIVRNLVHAVLDGSIAVCSAPGGGALFRLRFPRTTPRLGRPRIEDRDGGFGV